MIATVDHGRLVSLRPDKDHPLSAGFACQKGIAFTEVVNDPDRVTTPLRRTAAGFEPVSWDDALTDISVGTNVHGNGEGLEQLKATLKRYPGVRLVIDHLGRPPVEDGPPYNTAKDYFTLADFPNCYLKLTPSALKSTIKGKATADTLIPKLVSVFGANRIAWGSNYPASPGTMSEIVASSKEALRAVSDTDRSFIFAKTAQQLYPVLQD